MSKDKEGRARQLSLLSQGPGTVGHVVGHGLLPCSCGEVVSLLPLECGLDLGLIFLPVDSGRSDTV